MPRKKIQPVSDTALTDEQRSFIDDLAAILRREKRLDLAVSQARQAASTLRELKFSEESIAALIPLSKREAKGLQNVLLVDLVDRQGFPKPVVMRAAVKAGLFGESGALLRNFNDRIAATRAELEPLGEQRIKELVHPLYDALHTRVWVREYMEGARARYREAVSAGETRDFDAWFVQYVRDDLPDDAHAN